MQLHVSPDMQCDEDPSLQVAAVPECKERRYTAFTSCWHGEGIDISSAPDLALDRNPSLVLRFIDR